MAPLRLPFSARHLVQTRPRARILLAHNTRTITTSPLCRDKTENDSDKKANLLDKDAMNTSSNEYSKSAGDAEVAHTDAAFDPGNTSPEGQAGGVEQENNSHGNPTNVSPANKEISDPKESQNQDQPESSPSQQAGERKSSGGGSPAKGRSVK